mmetsp:Transcript_15847/g.37821  ORF Transcript_15847/g.37821 Transcript_15847/m.37821 type:complete len:226 (+) Transcript_15847:104-781(+)
MTDSTARLLSLLALCLVASATTTRYEHAESAIGESDAAPSQPKRARCPLIPHDDHRSHLEKQQAKDYKGRDGKGGGMRTITAIFTCPRCGQTFRQCPDCNKVISKAKMKAHYVTGCPGNEHEKTSENKRRRTDSEDTIASLWHCSPRSEFKARSEFEARSKFEVLEPIIEFVQRTEEVVHSTPHTSRLDTASSMHRRPRPAAGWNKSGHRRVPPIAHREGDQVGG